MRGPNVTYELWRLSTGRSRGLPPRYAVANDDIDVTARV